MGLINFKLKSLQETLPFGTEKDGYSLHWFGLTEGYYWFEVGNQRLLEFTREAAITYHIASSLPYVDYYLARLYQDLGYILVYILNPIPLDIFQRIATLETMFGFIAHQEAWLENAPAEETGPITPNWDTYLTASFLGHRKLDLGYIGSAPKLWFLRVEEEILVRWESHQKLENGKNIWTSTQGEYRISNNEFVGEIEAFLDHLCQQMSLKVEQACQRWPFLGVKIDLETLREEHYQHRSREFEEIKKELHMQKSSQENWDDIRASIEMIEKRKYWA